MRGGDREMKKILFPILALVLAVGVALPMAIAAAHDGDGTCDGTCANSVYDYYQGTEKDGSAIQPGRSDPYDALGSTDHEFFSLGFVEGETSGGWIIVEFEEYVGTCLTVVEQSPGTGYGYPLEQAEVYVSADSENPTNWTYLGIANNQITGGSETGKSHPNIFDLEECIKFVKIVDITDPGPHGNTADAFDLDSVCAGACPNNPPDCSGAYADPGCLWPPNHKFIEISIMGVTYPDGDPVTITITAITSDEPTASDEGSGGAKHAPDAYGVGTDTASVRAERSGDGDGRVYEVSFTASDGKGGECQGSVIVKVPHDQSDKTCPAVDSGQN
jgi:hypothetical protein